MEREGKERGQREGDRREQVRRGAGRWEAFPPGAWGGRGCGRKWKEMAQEEILLLRRQQGLEPVRISPAPPGQK